MDVTQVPGGSGTQAVVDQKTAARSSAITADFDTFLKMLTAQARYQDPMDPMDSAEYAAQLAQFSMVEQQVLTNEAISNLTSALTENGLSALSGWVGMDIRSPARLTFDGAPLTMLPVISSGADQAVLVARDANGREVQRLPVALDADQVSWSGTRPDGSAFPTGRYDFEVESWAAGQRLATAPVETYGRVREARLVDGVPALVLETGSVVAASDVTALRDAPG
jgi:flagellar basal-body rod modification protein FlgD